MAMRIEGSRFVITGGASLIGTHIAEQLLQAGAAGVCLFDNLSLGSEKNLAQILSDPRATLYRGDVLRQDQLREALEGASGVFSVAALLTLPLTANPALGIDVNVRGITNLLEASRSAGVHRIVQSSSVAVYGQDPTAGFEEDRPLAWNDLQPGGALYAATKTMAEIQLRLYRQKYGIDFVALRYPTVYGERQHTHGINVLQIIEFRDSLRQGRAPVLPGAGEEVHDYIYAGDVARANLLAMESALSGESLNIVSGIDTTLNEVVALLQRMLGTELPVEYRPLEGRVRFTATTALRFSRKKARDRLGWEPQVGLEEGLGRLFRWLDGDATWRA